MKEKIHCLIPARLGSQRLLKKNLLKINGLSLVELTGLKALETGLFTEVVINSESDEILDLIDHKNIHKYKRSNELANNESTSEDFIYDYFINSDADVIIQLHSIAPLLKIETIIAFVNHFKKNDLDTCLSIDSQWLEFLYHDKPLNFSYSKKENSQDLQKLQRINWAISGWRKNTFIKSYKSTKECGTYSGKIGFFEIDQLESLMIKELKDYKLAKIIYETTYIQ